MNSTIKKTFYTCSTELMFLRCENISKKAIELGSFLQSSEYIFLWHDGCVWKIKYVVKPYHEHSSKLWSMWQHHIPPKHFLLKALSNCYKFALLTVGFFTLHTSCNLSKFIRELHVLPCVFVRESNKKKRRSRIISDLTKGETFSSLMTTKYSWG